MQGNQAGASRNMRDGVNLEMGVEENRRFREGG